MGIYNIYFGIYSITHPRVIFGGKNIYQRLIINTSLFCQQIIELYALILLIILINYIFLNKYYK